MTTSRHDGDFGENPQTGYDVDAFDLGDPDLLEALDCVAQEPGSSGGHPPDSIEGRRAQLEYLNCADSRGPARYRSGIRSLRRGFGGDPGGSGGWTPTNPFPEWVHERYGH